MTLEEKVMQMHPYAKIFDGDKCLFCPDKYLRMHKVDFEREGLCLKSECKRCWNREYVPMGSNLERIRNMSIEELAIFISTIYHDDEDNTVTLLGDCIFDTTVDIRAWLESEVQKC